jgi:hypothetical protein
MFRLFKKKEVKTDNAVLVRAERAYQLLKQDVFNEAMLDVENALWEKFYESQLPEYKEREALYSSIKGMQLIKAQLEAYVAQGQFVKHVNESKRK